MNDAHEPEDEEEDDERYWETTASWRINELLDSAEFDSEFGTVTFEYQDWEEDARHTTNVFHSLEELRSALVEIGDAEVSADVPWEDGPVFDTDGIVDAALERAGIAGFFDSVVKADAKGDLLVSLDDLCAPGQASSIRLPMEELNALLIEHLARHPDLMRRLDPRTFEELVAELFHRMGYEVLLTSRTKDGGRDVLAVQRSDVGTLLTLVECKRFSPDHKVGVSLVRSLYGVVEAERATHGIIATTSSFTRGAAEFQKKMRYRLALKEFDDLAAWCSKYRKRRK